LKYPRNKIGYLLAALLAFAVAAALIIYPENAFAASVRGLTVWWTIVFPALLPFFIASEILTGLGVVHFVGVLLEPLMRPLFRVPGVGAFVMAVGLASGYPIGAMLSANHRERNELSKEEGERLMSFANTADPLFMSGAVAVGMLGWPQVGVTLVIAHYLSALSTGLLMRFHKPKAIPSPPAEVGRDFILTRAVRALIKARQQEKRPFAKLMGDAITKSINSLLVIGGFIISFSVVIDMLHSSGLVNTLSAWLSVPASGIMLLVNGCLEITLGCQEAAQSILPLSGKIIAVSAIVAWSGLSVHGQVASFISKTDMSIKPFIVARVIHAALAALYTALMFRLHLVSAVPASATDFFHVSLATRYWFSIEVLLKVLAVWAGTGLFMLLLTAITTARGAAFKVQSRN